MKLFPMDKAVKSIENNISTNLKKINDNKNLSIRTLFASGGRGLECSLHF